MTARFRQHRCPSGGVALGLRLGLPQPLAVRLSRLRTPERIQDFVNSLRWNLEGAGPTARSVSVTLRHEEAHCVEAAFIAACGWRASHRS